MKKHILSCLWWVMGLTVGGSALAIFLEKPFWYLAYGTWPKGGF